jgi:hypothetical protein
LENTFEEEKLCGSTIKVLSAYWMIGKSKLGAGIGNLRRPTGLLCLRWTEADQQLTQKVKGKGGPLA